MVAKALVDHGIEVTVDSAAEITSLSGYDAVVVGGALYNNHWHSDASDFVNRYASALRELPVWFFSSGPLDDSARSGALAPVAQVRDLARKFDIRGHMTFGGVLEHRAGGRLSAFLSYGEVGDWRDPNQVVQWAERIVAQLGEARTTIVVAEPAPPTKSAPKPAPDPEQWIELPDDENEAVEESRLGRIRRFISSEEVDDDAGLDVLL